MRKLSRWASKRLFLVGICAALVSSVAAQHLFIVDFKPDGIGVVDNLQGPSGVTLSEDGRFVFVTAEADNALTVFEREPLFGTPAFDQDFVDEENGVFGLFGARAVAAAPDGRHVYVAGAFDDSLLVFARDASTDSFVFVPSEAKQNGIGGVVGLERPSSVAVSPDDTQVFVTGEISDSVAVFSRDATNDTLTFVEAEIDGAGGVDTLAGASGVATSPDNRHVYVTSFVDDAITVFHRANGFLGFTTAYQDGVNGIDGLNGASGVAVSPDGNHVYVVAATDNTLATFERHSISGQLSLVDLERDGIDGVDGLDGAMAVAVSPVGNRVFVAARNDDSVTVFRRNPSTGELQFLEAKAPTVGLRGVESLAVSPDGLYVYAGCYDEDALTGLYVALCEGNELTGDIDDDAICNDLDACFGDDLTGDTDLDTVCDDIDACPGFDDALDADFDGVPDDCDQCAGDDATGDTDGDLVCNGSDICEGFDDSVDSDGDAVPDGCDACEGDDATGDSDLDLVCNDLDICMGFDDNVDTDSDTVPDGCDACEGDDATGDADGDLVCDDLDICAGNDATGDADGDLVCDDLDICAGNDATGDADGDLVCDDLDACAGNDATGDSDGDLVCDDLDVCMGFDDALDADFDGVPDGCDLCLGNDLLGDSDGDLVCDDLDICMGFDDNLDGDGDLVPDGCDLCLGDDAAGDTDGDGVCDNIDCAPSDTNASELDGCGICGGDNSTCSVFINGFESGDLATWSSVTGRRGNFLGTKSEALGARDP